MAQSLIPAAQYQFTPFGDPTVGLRIDTVEVVVPCSHRV